VRRASVAVLCVSFAVAACVHYTSGDPKRDPRATSPYGIVGTVMLPSGASVSGELLTVTDTSYVLLADRRIVVVPFASEVTATFNTLPRAVFGRPTRPEMDRLKLESRFPYGIPPVAMTALLAKYSQQGPDVAVPDEMFAAARTATQRYRDVSAAIADGYKKVGVEFPAMGEHWVNLPRVLEDTFSVATPPVLIYVNVDGTKRLAGVGYTALLGPGERPPRTPAPESAWHEHNGSVVDESFPLHHAHGAISDTSSLRLSILHAWIWTMNPAGWFETDNWALPFLRLGLERRVIDSAGLRGIALAMDKDSYYELMVRTGLGLARDGPEARTVERVVQLYRELAMATLGARNARRTLDDNSVQRLATVWDAMWSDLGRSLPSHATRLRELKARL
jgi:hypothetical protein